MFAAIAFFEKAGGVPPTRALSHNSLVKAAAESTEQQLGRDGGEKVEQCRLPFMMLVALELYVNEATHPLYLRYLAAVKLLKVWAGMRFDDTVGTPP